VPRLDEAFRVLAEKYGEAAVAGLFGENPAAVVRGEVLELDPMPRAVRKRKWYQLWS
jgi:hypothetical protein